MINIYLKAHVPYNLISHQLVMATYVTIRIESNAMVFEIKLNLDFYGMAKNQRISTILGCSTEFLECNDSNDIT